MKINYHSTFPHDVQPGVEHPAVVNVRYGYDDSAGERIVHVTFSPANSDPDSRTVVRRTHAESYRPEPGILVEANRIRDQYADENYYFDVNPGSHCCEYVTGACRFHLFGPHGGHLEQLTSVEYQVIEDSYGQADVNAVQLLLALRYGT